MKKTVTSILMCSLLAPIIWNGSIAQAEKTDNILSTEQILENEREGLLGYYFKGPDFNDLVTFAPTHANNFLYNHEAVNQLLNKDQEIYQSISWIGLLKSEKTGNFTFKFSYDQQAIIEIDGKVVSNQGKEKQKVHLEKDKLVSIRIEYKPQAQLHATTQSFQNLKLYKIDATGKEIPINQKDLRNPDLNTEQSQTFLKKASKTSLFSKTQYNEFIDTDGDSIPDLWEENGYTIQNKVAVKWTDDLASKGYKKFVSNPHESHTVGDPYTDYEKAARDIDRANAKETFNPLVAAYPSINVSLEEMLISPYENLENSTALKTINNWTYSTSKSALDRNISENYQHSDVVGVEADGKKETFQLKNDDRVYLNANIRYNNVGTGMIYDTKPHTRFTLGHSTIGTIKAYNNRMSLSIMPGESYPQKGIEGIPFNTMTDFNYQPIPLKHEQMDEFYLGHKPIMLSTDQIEGEYKIKDVHGRLVTGGQWNHIIPHIKGHTASIIINNLEKVSEKRVAAKDYDYPDDKTPSLTLKDALKLSYPDQIKEKGSELYYNNIPFRYFEMYIDRYTYNEMEKQIMNITQEIKGVDNVLEHIKLTPNMNFTFALKR
ncbi:binary toxin-like calcium binding domain-containing protein [Bacillus cereus]|uniref:binary toxin-like calcium binding domain-containing protein n=1 Tax=Bacillus cereus TaxID=1396 RepID=UPI0018F569D4|nr:binary toxin-like calcium binding domain-containing protein [Bacillus cereus]MBJ8154288.1 hypothetical protein [Bacillus cereus]